MLRKSTSKMPNFKSEAEEAAWYTTPEGRRQTQREYVKALKEGTVIRSNGINNDVLLELMRQAKERTTRAISIRLPIADIERAREIAEQEGIGYQTVLRETIHKGLKKAG